MRVVALFSFHHFSQLGDDDDDDNDFLRYNVDLELSSVVVGREKERGREKELGAPLHKIVVMDH